MKLSEYSTTSFMIDKNGDIIPVAVPIPCTNYIRKKLDKLSPADAEFLLSHNMINEMEATSIVLESFLDYMSDCSLTLYNILNVIQFTSWAQMKETPTVRSIALHLLSKGTILDVLTLCTKYPAYRNINNQWYSYIRDSLVKMCIINNTVEFTIGTEDITSWRVCICKQVLPRYVDELRNYTVSIISEDSFQRNTIIENVDISQLVYSKIRMFRPSSYIHLIDTAIQA